MWRDGLRLVISVLTGTAFHALWVVAFIFAASRGASDMFRGILWLAAPVVGAAGFASGLTLMWRDGRRTAGFALTFGKILSGCAIGAGLMSPIGPMFVGFGLLAGGALAAAIVCFSDSRRAGVEAEQALTAGGRGNNLPRG